MLYHDSQSLILDLNLPRNHCEGRYIGIDYGTKKTGVSISTKNNSMALPVDTFQTKLVIPEISKYISQQDIRLIIVGYPFEWDEESSIGTHITNFTQSILTFFPTVPVLLYDENRSSQTIRNKIIEKYGKINKRQLQQYDKYVATLILQNFLNQLKSEITHSSPLSS